MESLNQVRSYGSVLTGSVLIGIGVVFEELQRAVEHVELGGHVLRRFLGKQRQGQPVALAAGAEIDAENQRGRERRRNGEPAGQSRSAGGRARRRVQVEGDDIARRPMDAGDERGPPLPPGLLGREACAKAESRMRASSRGAVTSGCGAASSGARSRSLSGQRAGSAP
jgi:hypothetical protein